MSSLLCMVRESTSSEADPARRDFGLLEAERSRQRDVQSFHHGHEILPVHFAEAHGLTVRRKSAPDQKLIGKTTREPGGEDHGQELLAVRRGLDAKELLERRFASLGRRSISRTSVCGWGYALTARLTSSGSRAGQPEMGEEHGAAAGILAPSPIDPQHFQVHIRQGDAASSATHGARSRARARDVAGRWCGRSAGKGVAVPGGAAAGVGSPAGGGPGPSERRTVRFAVTMWNPPSA